MSKLTLAIPFYNKLREAKGIMGLLKYVTSSDTEWMIIDNASEDNIEEFFAKYLKPSKIDFVKNEENMGLVKTYQQIIDRCQTQYLVILHSDVYIYEKDWDKRVIDYFEKMPDLGMIGFFGAQGCLPNGGRIQDMEYANQMPGWSNLIEAEIHGTRLKEDFMPVGIFDGFALIFRKKMLEQSGGIPEDYLLHHIYDREFSLVSLALGYKNIVINVSCHHVGGMSAGQIYDNWMKERPEIPKETDNPDKWIHDHNTQVFEKRWKDVLPLYVEKDFSFRTGLAPIYLPDGQLEYKGDKIIGSINSL